MNIQIHSVRFDADKKLLDFVSQKMNKLSQVSDDIVSAEVFLRLDHDDERENKVTEIKVEYPGGPLFARKQSKTFEEATDLVVAALKRQIVKQKNKLRGV
ncbi:MAG: ribosome-associated translation inhibitor RaiA [Bacteroidales bacterium]|jgi:putative sigma-54 modulation protein|nr:ribosome-associated translation inhibitor RaiA [Bacteroidales bacterium]